MTQYLSLLVCTLYLLASVDRVGSYFATIDAHAEECFFEKVAAGTRLALRFEVIEGGFLDIDVRIHGPDGNTVYQGDRESTGNYMFAAHLDGVYRYCFSNKMSSLTPKIIMFSMDVGIKQVADNTTSDADHNKLDEMIIELANSMTSVKHEQEYMQIRQRVHFMVNESTNNRVLLWSFFEAALLIAMTAGQVYYLRRFFEVRRIV